MKKPVMMKEVMMVMVVGMVQRERRTDGKKQDV